MAVDEEIKAALDGKLLAWKDVTTRRMFGGVAYMVERKMFCMLTDGTLGMKLPDDLRSQALTLAGVSPFISPSGGQFGQWIQFLVLFEEYASAAMPWLEAAFKYVRSAPAPRRRSRRSSG